MTCVDDLERTVGTLVKLVVFYGLASFVVLFIFLMAFDKVLFCCPCYYIDELSTSLNCIAVGCCLDHSVIIRRLYADDLVLGYRFAELP